MDKKETAENLLDIIKEHNRLNGFRFVLVEFAIVSFVALMLSLAEMAEGNNIWGLIFLGIFINALSVLLICIKQTKIQDANRNQPTIWSKKYRKQIGIEHPGLLWHTLILTFLSLIPLAIPVILLLQEA